MYFEDIMYSYIYLRVHAYRINSYNTVYAFRVVYFCTCYSYSITTPRVRVENKMTN